MFYSAKITLFLFTAKKKTKLFVFFSKKFELLSFPRRLATILRLFFHNDAILTMPPDFPLLLAREHII